MKMKRAHDKNGNLIYIDKTVEKIDISIQREKFKQLKQAKMQEIKLCRYGSRESNDNVKELIIKRGDRFILPNGDEYSLSWDNVRESLELTKTYSDNEQGLTICPGVSNKIYIK